MSKRNKIIYWIATVWLALAMIASAVQQIFNIGGFVEIMERLQYPAYFAIILGIWKIAGVITILLPKLTLVKEWAYAGFFFVTSGAIFSHFAMNESIIEILPALVLLLMTILSWYFRPANRKLIIKRNEIHIKSTSR